MIAALSRYDKPDITFDTFAEISRLASSGTITASTCAGVTTPPIRVHRQLLHDTVDRRGKDLLPGLLLPLDDVLGKARGSLLGFREIVVERPAVFRFRLYPGLGEFGHCRLGLVQLALLDKDVMLLADQVLKLR